MEQLDQITKIARGQHYDSILAQADALKIMLLDNEMIDVVVLGQFKAGKSSLINSFLKEPVLPVGVLPVTAVITRLAYGKEKKAVVEKLNGEQVEISVDRLHEYITEKDNPENTKQVLLADIRLPELKPFKNLRFIDTPGLGSAFKHNTEVTQNWFKNIGAAIVVISIAQPLSESDLELIRSAVEQSPEVYLILSKADLVNIDEIKDVEIFIKERTRKMFNRDFRVFPYSTLNGTGKYKQAIIEGVFKKFSEKVPETNRRIFAYKLGYLSRLTKSYLTISLNLQNKKEDERRELKDRIIDEQLKLSYVKQELAYIAQNYKTATRTKLEEEFIGKFQDVLTNKMRDELGKSFDNWQGNLNKISRNYETWIRENMAAAMMGVENNEKEFLQNHVDETRKHFNNYLSGFRERLNQNLEKVLGVKMPEDDFEIEVRLMEKANISVSWAFESQIDLLWFLIPMSFFRKTFRKYFLKQIPREVEKNLRRLVSLLSNNINAVIDELHLQAVNYIVSELDNIRGVLDTPVTGSRKIEEQIQLLEKNIRGN